MTEPLLLLDGHSLAYRAFFALPPTIATSSGQPTNAVYGFTSMLIRLLADIRTRRIGVAFDMGAPTVRLAEYSGYKAQRAETPGEFRGQIDLIKDVLEALEVPMFGVPDHEADDVIATLARQAVDEGLEVVCVTADRDYFQLVRPGVKVLFNRKGVSETDLYDEQAVTDRFGLPPASYIDYAALRGDPSDNLPGVPGVGEKTASQLIDLFGSVEGVYENLDSLPKRIARLRPALEEAREQVLMNKRLVRLVDDIELGVDPATIVIGDADESRVREVFSALQFRALLDRWLEARPMPDAAPEQISLETGDPIDVSTMTVIALMPSATGGIAVAGPDEAPKWFADPSPLSETLADPGVSKVAHGWKDLSVDLARRGLSLRGVGSDTRVAAYLLDPAPGRYDLADLSLRYLRRPLPEVGDPGQGQLELGLSDPDQDEAGAAGARAAALLELAGHLDGKVDEAGMGSLYRDVEIPLGEVLADMERTGVAVDIGLLEAQSRSLGEQIGSLEAQAFELAGGPFNLNSPPQLRTILYERLGLKPSRRTKTGYSTDAAALESIRGEHEIVDLLLEHRELSKLKSTYLESLPRLADAEGRVHCVFDQTATATGRISSHDPNLQNVPVRTETGREIRRAFVAGFGGHRLLVADYSQIELRVLAHVTGDQGLRDAFAADEDIHAATAAKIWGFDVGDVPRDLRARAKAINFGLTYGMNRFGLASRLGITPDEADTFIEGYFRSFPGVRTYMTDVVRDAYRDGSTTTLLGRRRWLPELAHGDQRVRALGERQALNAPIQGSAADIIKLAMIKVHNGLRESGLGARMVLTVHDELVFEVPSSEADDTLGAVRSLMEQAYPLDVPLRVDISTGDNWADAKD